MTITNPYQVATELGKFWSGTFDLKAGTPDLTKAASFVPSTSNQPPDASKEEK